jgi:hypothetical protein
VCSGLPCLDRNFKPVIIIRTSIADTFASDHLTGFVSDAALQAGGLVHGIIPQALTGRAAERAVRKLRSPTEAEASPESGSGKEAAVEGSKEGTGEEVGTDARVSDRFTSEVVNTMHEASLPYILRSLVMKLILIVVLNIFAFTFSTFALLFSSSSILSSA